MLEAYRRFRDGYEDRWRVFDPIAGRVAVTPEGLSLDLSVMPLIEGSDYRELRRFMGNSKLAPDAGDAHSEAMLTFAMSLDHDSAGVDELEELLQWDGAFGADALAWMGGHVAIYADVDAFWSELAEAEDAETIWENGYRRLPVCLEIGVDSQFRLAKFMKSLEDSFGGFFGTPSWSDREHAGVTYVCMGPEDEEELDGFMGQLALYYVVLPETLVFSYREDMIQRAIERSVHREAWVPTDDVIEHAHEAWLGESVALRVDSRALDMVRGLARERWDQRMRVQAWKALPILNEWHRRFPDQDPVLVHERLWGTRLVCPGGGGYEWDAEAGTMTSTLYGTPVHPTEGPDLPDAVLRLESLDMGVTFEEDSLRARVEVVRRPR